MLQEQAILSSQEVEQLQICETTIERGLQTFIEVGEALSQIRDARLYRQAYSNFEDYCLDRWGISIRQSQRLMNASTVIHNLKQGDQLVALPTSEYQIRSLASLKPRSWSK